MKNYLLRNCTFATMLLASTLTFTSCGDDEDDDEFKKPGTEKPSEPSASDALTPTQQKARLETVAKEALNMMPASDFSTYTDLANYIDDVYGDNYNWDSVDKWARQCWDDALKATGKTYKDEDRYASYYYTEYKCLLLASNFTGHFSAYGPKWTKEAGTFKDLQFAFVGKNGEDCVLKVETSGKVTKVYVGDWDDWKNGNYDYSTGASKDYYDRINCTIGVPEKIVVTLTQGNTTLVRTNVQVALSGLSGEKFDIAKGNVNISADVELSNGYVFSTSKVSYAGNSKLNVAAASVKKDGKAIVTVAMSGDIKGLPSCNVDAFSKDNFNRNDYDTESVTAKNAFVKLDVLGKVQMQGVISDVRQYCDALDMADKQDENETAFKSFVKKANSLADINLFYDNSSVKQAAVQLEAFAETEWGGYKYWEMEPVLVFFDGSSSSMFDVFFNDTDFKNTINAFEALIDKYEDLID